MNRVKIDIIQLGESKYKDEWSFLHKLKKNKSKVFEITNIRKISLPQSDLWGYTDATLQRLIKHSESADCTLCFIDYPLEGNFFARRLSGNVGVATFYQTGNIFSESNIDLKNFIMLQIYKIVLLSKLDTGTDINGILKHFHDETRGCLFDMCGLKEDIVVSAVGPKICFQCEAKLGNTLLDVEFIDLLNKELKRIKKPTYFRITDWIKRHPILSITLAAGSSLLLNVLASFIYDAMSSFFTYCL